MKNIIDFLVTFKQYNTQKTIEQMKRMNGGIYKDLINECMEKGYFTCVSLTPLGIECYSLSDLGEKMAEEEMRLRNKKFKDKK